MSFESSWLQFGSDMIKTVGVVGAGTMGNGIRVFAQSGFSVTLVDVAPPMLTARAAIEKSLAKFVDKAS